MLQWIGATNSPVLNLAQLFEAKIPIGTVKFHMVKGELRQAMVKVSDAPGAVKSGWLYWMQVKVAKGHGIQDGSIVHVTKGMKPLLPGQIDPDTGKPAPDMIHPKPAAAPGAPVPAPAAPAAPPLPPAPVAAAPKEEPPAAKPPPEEPKLEPVTAKEPEAPPPASPKEEPKPEPKVEPKPEPKPEPKVEPKVEPEAPKAEPEPKTAAEPDKHPPVVGPSKKEIAPLKKKVPLGTIRYHAVKAGEPAKQVWIRASDDPAVPKGGWRYLMSASQAAKLGLNHDDVVSFSLSAENKVELHKDEKGAIKKISTAADLPKEAEPPKKEPEASKEEPKPEKASEPVKELPKEAPKPVEMDPKYKEMLAYIKTMPGFEKDPDQYMKAGTDAHPTIWDDAMKHKWGADWFEKWKLYHSLHSDDGAAKTAPTGPEATKKPEPEPEPELMPYDSLPVGVKAKLKDMNAGPNSLLGMTVRALVGNPKLDVATVAKLIDQKVGAAQVAIDHLKDSGHAIANKDGTYSLSGEWTTSPLSEPTVKAPKAPEPVAKPPTPAPKQAVKLPSSIPDELKSLLKKHDIDPASDVAHVVRVLHNTPASSHELVNALPDSFVAPTLAWLEKKGFVKQDKSGVYTLSADWTSASPEEPEVSKPESEPEPEAEPEESKAKKKPSGPAAGKDVMFAPEDIPEVDDLKYVASGNEQGMGGAGEKHIYKDKKGQDWIFKIAMTKGGQAEKPFAAHAQEGFSNIARKVKNIQIPVKIVHIKGKMGTLQPLIPNSGTLKAAPPASSLSPQEREDIASEHMLDWLMSQHDSFGANLVRTKTGRIVGVDKEQGFRYFGEDKLSTSYQPNTEQYSEQPPYYNQFWKEWADKKFDFDPSILKKYADSIDAIDADDFVDNFKPYAESFWEDKPKKQEEFLNEVRKRKKNFRSDFEGFLSDLYKQRTEQTEGGFTFEAGWVPGAKAEAGKKIKKKYSAEQIAGDYGILTKAYIPLAGPEQGKEDPTKIALKTGKGAEGAEKLAKFVKELKLTPYIPDYNKGTANPNGIVSGNTYNWAFFEKKDWEKAHVEKVEELGSTTGNTPAKPEYFPEVSHSPAAHSNLHELDGIHHSTIPALGKRLTLDGGFVEGQWAKAKKFKDKKGETYYLFQFKLRENVWQNIHGGAAGNWAFTYANWDPSEQLFVESLGNSDQCPAKKWTNGASDLHLATGTDKWSYMGSMYARIRPKKGQTPAQALREMLETVQSGLADKVLTPPTPEEREVVKLSRVLWSVAPQESDKLPENKRTISELKKRLKMHGYDEHKLSALKEVEAFPGYAAWAEPNRHKEVANGKLKYLFNGISSAEAALSVMQYGLLGIHERNLMGIHEFGGSYPQDVHSGSGDGILTRVITESGFGDSFTSHSFHGSFQAIIAPTEVDRLDTYMYDKDTYGRCRSDSADWKNRSPVADKIKQQQHDYSEGAEMSFRRGIGRDKILRIACTSEATRKALVKQAKQAGIMQVNGVPVDDFVVVCSNLGDAYTKYVKPLGF